MKKKIFLLVAALFATTSCDQPRLQQVMPPIAPATPAPDPELQGACDPPDMGGVPLPGEHKAVVKDAVLEERKKLIPAISAAFERRTNPERAKWLAKLCYEKTLGTLFTPLDLAEIALAETGGHKLSSRAVSPCGAMGVWQLMPERAISHGFHPKEMRNDEKCAEAAVRELFEKLKKAKGNLSRAKRLYCGAGPAAKAYDVKRRLFRKEILQELEQVRLKQEIFRELNSGALELATRG